MQAGLCEYTLQVHLRNLFGEVNLPRGEIQILQRPLQGNHALFATQKQAMQIKLTIILVDVFGKDATDLRVNGLTGAGGRGAKCNQTRQVIQYGHVLLVVHDSHVL
jgi:hypothetical protein